MCKVFVWQINGNILDSCSVAGFGIHEVGLLCSNIRKIRIKMI
jgi:hypothetical protein